MDEQKNTDRNRQNIEPENPTKKPSDISKEISTEISIEKNYAVNSDFGQTRLIHHEYELVDYQDTSRNRIWLNEQDTPFASHWHPALEIIQPVQNNYTVICGDTSREIGPGQILLIPPGQRHELIAPPSGKRYIYLLNVAAFSKLQSFARVMYILSQPLVLSQEDEGETYDTVCDLLWQIRDEYFNEREFSDLTIPSLLLRILVCIGKNYRPPAHDIPKSSHARSRDYMELFSETLNYIDEHFSESLTLEEMASRTGFSKFHFSRLFKKYTHYNFIDYLHFRRIKEAEQLLLRPDTSITDIAITSGFSSISTFNRIFRQEKGCSPSEYRDRIFSGHPVS